MTEKNNEENYWRLVEEFIGQANENLDIADVGLIAAALLQASARYSAFYLANSAESRKDLKEDKEALLQDIPGEFKKHFAFHLEDFIENYKVLLNKSEQP